MKTIVVHVSCRVEVRLPDDSPALQETTLAALANLGANEWSDGRFPYSTETVQQGALRIVENGLHAVLDAHHTTAFGLDAGCPPEKYPLLTERNAAVARDLAAARLVARGTHGPITVTLGRVQGEP